MILYLLVWTDFLVCMKYDFPLLKIIQENYNYTYPLVGIYLFTVGGMVITVTQSYVHILVNKEFIVNKWLIFFYKTIQVYAGTLFVFLNKNLAVMPQTQLFLCCQVLYTHFQGEVQYRAASQVLSICYVCVENYIYVNGSVL